MPAAFIHELGPNKMAILTDLADELEHRQSQDLGEKTVTKPLLAQLESGEQPAYERSKLSYGVYSLIGGEPRLPEMAEGPTSMDFVCFCFFNRRSKTSMVQTPS
jgi:hypothetical protein